MSCSAYLKSSKTLGEKQNVMDTATMYRDTRFGELMKGLPRKIFEKIVNGSEADKYRKCFHSWDHLLVMVYAQITGCRSLREIESGYNSQSTHHYRLGSQLVKRSTLSDANTNRSSEIFRLVCEALMCCLHKQLRRELKSRLYLLDATPIMLQGLGYDEWTKSSKTMKTQGLKVHLQTAAEVALPIALGITPPNVNDIEFGKKIELESGVTYAFDKGYYDYGWWFKIAQSQSFFVTRFKANACLKVTGKLRVPSAATNIIEDAQVQLTRKYNNSSSRNPYYGKTLRRITVKKDGPGNHLVLATNDFERSAEDIANVYKQRWEIELFFKWIKQNLRIKKFIGRSENAVKTQIYTALITYMLIYMYKQQQKVESSLKLFLVTLKTGLFQAADTERRRQRYRSRCLQLKRGLIS